MNRRTLAMLALLTQPLVVQGQSDGREATSLLGRPLMRQEVAAENRERLEKELADARTAYQQNPGNADAIIWLGRRTAYLGRFRESIEIFSEGIRKHPSDARMYRHRGHRYISVREFDNAIRDLERAASLQRGQPDQVEPDGAPNRFNIPIGTLQSNISVSPGPGSLPETRFRESAARLAGINEAGQQRRSAGLDR